MEFTARGSALLEGFQVASSVVGPRATREVTRNIKVIATKSGIGIHAVGEEASLWFTVPLESFGKGGEVVLPGETLVGVLREVRDQEVRFKVEGARCEITVDGSVFHVLGEDSSSFPAPREFDAAKAVTISATLLASMLARTVFAASTEDNRYAMNGVLFVPEKGSFELVATDGRRLAHVKSKVPTMKKSAEVVVPRTSIAHVMKLLPDDADSEVKIEFGDAHVAFQTKSGTIFSRLIDGTFPPYRDVIPKETSFKVDFDIGVLHSAVRRASLLADPANKTVAFKFSAGALELSSHAADRGDAKISLPVTYDREGDFLIHFNPDFVGDCLRVIQGDSVSFEFTTPAKQSMLRDGDGLTYIIMPVTPNA